MEEKTIVTASIDDLADRIANKIEERIIARTNYTKADRYLSRRQLSELLDVDLSTLHRWSRSGVLPSHRIGGKILYIREDVESALKRVPNLKDGRG